MIIHLSTIVFTASPLGRSVCSAAHYFEKILRWFDFCEIHILLCILFLAGDAKELHNILVVKEDGI